MTAHTATDLIDEAYERRQEQTITTTDATQTTIDSFTLKDEKAYFVETTVVGKETDASDRCCKKLIALAYRDGGGNATIQGSIVTPFSEFSDVAWSVDITVSGNDIRLRVTGAASETIKWACSMEVIEL